MQKGGAVYIMTNANKTALYIGVTSNLIARIQQHKTKFYPKSFTAKYNIVYLVYYKNFPGIEEAIYEEKRLKAGNREQKLMLINSINPEWKDLWEELSKW